MKKLLALFAGALAVIAALVLAPAAFADSDDPVIVHAPQSYEWMEGATAMYFCEVEGDPAKLYTYRWHIVYQGKDYLMSEANGSQPWEAGAGASYGPNKDSYSFGGIGKELDGAEIYCVVSNSTGMTESPHAMIMVRSGSFFFPPEITAPVTVTCMQGEKVALTVKASCRSGNVSEKGDFLSYEWMECGTPSVESAILIGWKTGNIPTDPTYYPSTDVAGTFYYVCRVYDGQGGSMENESYSNVITLVVNPGAHAGGSGDMPSGSGGSGSGGGSGSSGSGGGIISSSTGGGGNSVTVTTDPGTSGGGNSVTVTTDPGTSGEPNQGNQGNQGGSAGMATGVIIAIACGALVLAALIAAIVILALKNKKTKEEIAKAKGGVHTGGAHAGGAHVAGAHAKPEAPAPESDDDWK